MITLLIKKKYFNQILNEEKKEEFRSVKPFYEKMFIKEPKTLKLHYQGNENLIVEVLNIEKIKTPEELLNSDIQFPDKVFRIKLGKILEYSQK